MVENNHLNLNDKYFEKVRVLYPESFLTDSQINLILDNSSSEEQLKVLFYYLSMQLKTMPNIKENGNVLFNNIDESQYNTDQWLEAIEFMHTWLEKENRNTSFIMLIGYIQCSSAAPENKIIKYRLKDLVKEMLKTYGFNG